MAKQTRKPVKMAFKYKSPKDGKITNRVVEWDLLMLTDKEGKDYFKGLTLSVDGQAPSHPYSTYLESGIVENSMYPIEE